MYGLREGNAGVPVSMTTTTRRNAFDEITNRFINWLDRHPRLLQGVLIYLWMSAVTFGVSVIIGMVGLFLR